MNDLTSLEFNVYCHDLSFDILVIKQPKVMNLSLKKTPITFTEIVQIMTKYL